MKLRLKKFEAAHIKDSGLDYRFITTTDFSQLIDETSYKVYVEATKTLNNSSQSSPGKWYFDSVIIDLTNPALNITYPNSTRATEVLINFKKDEPNLNNIILTRDIQNAPLPG